MFEEDPIRRLLRDLLLLERDLFRTIERDFTALPVEREFFSRAPTRLPFAGPNIRETESEYIITIPLPGVRKEDINLYLVDNKLVLDVKSQRRMEKKDEKENFVSIGAINIHQEFPLPPNADPNKIEAEYRNGLLIIRIKKAGNIPPIGRKIDIK